MKLHLYESLYFEEDNFIYQTRSGRWAFKDKSGKYHYYDTKPEAQTAYKGVEQKSFKTKSVRGQSIKGFNNKLISPAMHISSKMKGQLPQKFIDDSYSGKVDLKAGMDSMLNKKPFKLNSDSFADKLHLPDSDSIDIDLNVRSYKDLDRIANEVRDVFGEREYMRADQAISYLKTDLLKDLSEHLGYSKAN
jgi:hypothetical protein